MNKFALFFASAILAVLPSASARADTLTFTINNPVQIIVPGSTLAFSGTLTASSTNTGNTYLNGDSFSSVGPFTVDDSAFFNIFPAFLTPGQSFTGTLFNIAVPLNPTLGTYSGSFTILGGSNDTSTNALASANFSVAATPEPSSLLLVGSGILGAMGFARRRFTHAS